MTVVPPCTPPAVVFIWVTVLVPVAATPMAAAPGRWNMVWLHSSISFTILPVKDVLPAPVAVTVIWGIIKKKGKILNHLLMYK